MDMMYNTYSMNMLICHKFYGCIWENAQKSCRVALKKASHAVFSIDLGSCAESTAPGSCDVIDHESLQLQVRITLV